MGKPEAAEGRRCATHCTLSGLQHGNERPRGRKPVAFRDACLLATSKFPPHHHLGEGEAVKVPRNLRLPRQDPGRMEGMSAFDGSGRQTLYELALENDVDHDDRHADDGGAGHDQGKVARIP